MKLTVIGASPACPNPGDASSGYLFEAGGKALLVDCGPGVVARLQQFRPYWQLDYIVISHFHADHVLDLIPLRYGLRLGPQVPQGVRVPLYVPPQAQEKLDTLVRLLDPTGGGVGRTFVVVEYAPEAGLTLGPFTLSFVAVHHYVPAWGMRITADGVTVAYSADTGPCPGLERLAQGADLFICEATLPQRRKPEHYGHMTPDEVGEVAARAGVRRVLLTHIWDGVDRAEFAARASKTFGGPVEVARSGMVIEIGR